MKFEVKQNELMNAINIANKAVSKNTNIQIHELIYFEAIKDRLSLTAFDGEITIKTSISAIVKEEGVDLNTLADRLQEEGLKRFKEAFNDLLKTFT